MEKCALHTGHVPLCFAMVCYKTKDNEVGWQVLWGKLWRATEYAFRRYFDQARQYFISVIFIWCCITLYIALFTAAYTVRGTKQPSSHHKQIRTYQLPIPWCPQLRLDKFHHDVWCTYSHFCYHIHLRVYNNTNKYPGGSMLDNHVLCFSMPVMRYKDVETASSYNI